MLLSLQWHVVGRCLINFVMIALQLSSGDTVVSKAREGASDQHQYIEKNLNIAK